MARWSNFFAMHMEFVANCVLPNDTLVFQLDKYSNGNWAIAIFRDHTQGSKRILVVHVKIRPGRIGSAARRVAHLAHRKLIAEPRFTKTKHHQFTLE